MWHAPTNRSISCASLLGESSIAPSWPVVQPAEPAYSSLNESSPHFANVWCSDMFQPFVSLSSCNRYALQGLPDVLALPVSLQLRILQCLAACQREVATNCRLCVEEKTYNLLSLAMRCYATLGLVVFALLLALYPVVAIVVLVLLLLFGWLLGYTILGCS